MSDLLDIAPATATENVTLSDGAEVTVHRLHFDQIAALAARFPKLIALVALGENALPQLISGGGVVMAPIIAAGCGHPGDEKAERIAATLLPDDQIKLFKAIYWLTYPNGIGAFLETMASLATGPVKNQVKVRLKKSPSESPSLSDEDSRPIMQ
jgi:hypothetical protein